MCGEAKAQKIVETIESMEPDRPCVLGGGMPKVGALVGGNYRAPYADGPNERGGVGGGGPS